jgi:predicted dehydrogenase
VGFVRWTEQRNFEAVLDMMESGRLNVRPLISHRFTIDNAEKAYEAIARGESSLGILLEYPVIGTDSEARTVRLSPDVQPTRPDQPADAVVVSFIGSGNYATRVLIPAFKVAGAHLDGVASGTGVSAVHAGRKFGFEEVTTDSEHILAGSRTNAVVIATRHDSHAALVCRALEAGMHVFVEKPLALQLKELDEIEKAYGETRRRGQSPIVMVGFNRRFAPQIQKVKAMIVGTRDPKAFVMTVNAGAIPSDHWTQDVTVGGGRIVGEACHFIDLLRFLAGAPIARRAINRMSASTSDTVAIELSFEDGSIGTIHYLANGSKSFAKERLEVFSVGRVLQLDNFRRLTGYGWPGFRRMNLWRQNKGQEACVAAFVRAVKSRSAAPIPFEELMEVSRVAIEVAELAR